MLTATCIAPVNIAVIKYWGKRNEELILPINDSVSGTLSTDQLCAKTSIAADPLFTENKMWLNGVEVNLLKSERLNRCIEAIRRLAEAKLTDKSILLYKLHICSENNFPTAAGLASSAAGYACFVYTLATLYGVENEELSAIARLGSGSACRSIYGGFVHWKKGKLPDGSDSIAVQIAPAEHWPEMHVVVLVVSDTKKKVSSSLGMAQGVRNSAILKYRASDCVPSRVTQIRQAILDKNFPIFGELTMKESNQFHAVCLDTYPPCVYMNDVSHSVAALVHKYNDDAKTVRVAYTFDAGANACIYLLEKEVPKFLSFLNILYPNDKVPANEYIRGIPVEFKTLKESIGANVPLGKNVFKYIIHTKIGNGPRRLDDNETLLNQEGTPIKLQSESSENANRME